MENRTLATVDSNFQAKWDEFLARTREIYDLSAIGALMSWDQSTYMPSKGGTVRGRQLALVERLAHERRTDPALGRLLDDLQPYAERLGAEDDRAAMLCEGRRSYERAVRIPASFASAFAEHTSESFMVWIEARPANNFAAVQPYLQKTLDMSREMSRLLGAPGHIADPLIDFADRGFSVAELRPLFGTLGTALTSLVKQIGERPQVDNSVLHRFYPKADQLAYGEQVARAFGYDFQRGRQDETYHPFMTKFGHDDVRITTRVDEHDLGNALFGTLHEAGHALYELGIDPAYASTVLDGGTSSGVHESQSRLWENIVGRSAGFWQYAFPSLQAAFPRQLADVTLEAFYHAVNRVAPSLIRTEADEVTYNLHVIIRFGLELDLLEGKLAIADLPEAWHARYNEAIGVCAPSDVDGVLQDVHWYGGPIGGSFQGYTLGNMMAAQFYAAAVAAHPGIETEISRGQFSTLHSWLRENVYRHGAKYAPGDLLMRATGQPLTVKPYLEYLCTKFGGIYGALTLDVPAFDNKSPALPD